MRRRVLPVLLGLAAVGALSAGSLLAVDVGTSAAGSGSHVGGPDAYGYRFVDSTVPGGPSFHWIDATGGSVVGNNCDDCLQGAIDFPTSLFPSGFPFYDKYFPSVCAESDGVLTFDPTRGCVPSTSAQWDNTALPSSGANNGYRGEYNYAIYPYWVDQDDSCAGNIYDETVGSQFVIEFVDYLYDGGHCYSSDLRVYEVVFTRGSPNILVQYETVQAGDSQTIGVQQGDGAPGQAFLQYDYNDAPFDPASGSAVLFYYSPPPPSSTSAPTVTSVSPNQIPDGASGQALALTGSGYLSGAQVSFGGSGVTTDSVTVNSPTSITATVSVDPNATPGARDVVVTNPDGGQGRCVQCLTVTSAPAPTTTTTVPPTTTTTSPPTTTTSPPTTTPPAGPCAGAGVENPTSDQAWVCRLYADLLGRPADASGLAYWTAQLSSGTPRESVASAITASEEYRTDLVTGYYERYLHRAPDPGGLSAWVGLLEAGGPDEAVQAGLLGGAEYFADHGSTNDAWLTGVYEDLLGRAPDPSGRAHWESALAGGASRTDVAGAILTGAEYRSDLVISYYERFLRRTPAASEVAGWVRFLDAGATDEQVVAGITSSAEYFSASA